MLTPVYILAYNSIIAHCYVKTYTSNLICNTPFFKDAEGSIGNGFINSLILL